MGQHAAEMEQIVMNVRDLTQSAKVFTAHLQEVSTASKDDLKEVFAILGETVCDDQINSKFWLTLSND
jgi:hypothetical protein